jgi:hypothetical protein
MLTYAVLRMQGAVVVRVDEATAVVFGGWAGRELGGKKK